MQKDFMGMAQGQQAPATSEQMTPEEAEGMKGILKQMPTMDSMKSQGLPGGESKEDIKQRLLAMLQQVGVLELYKTPAEKQQFTQELNQLIEAFMNQDAQAIENNPIMIKLTELTQGPQTMPQQPTGGPVPQQGAAPKDFSAMMPPTPGGGMLGR
jgi:uncharacterized protein YicC (UPF0701 family)